MLGSVVGKVAGEEQTGATYTQESHDFLQFQFSLGFFVVFSASHSPVSHYISGSLPN